MGRDVEEIAPMCLIGILASGQVGEKAVAQAWRTAELFVASAEARFKSEAAKQLLEAERESRTEAGHSGP